MNTTRTLFATLLVMTAAPAAWADTIQVPQDQQTIQAAVNAALDGDVIEIKGGKYAESVTVTGKTNLHILGKGTVTLLPAAGAGMTLVDCTGVIVEKIRVRDVLEDGFLLQGCTGGSLLQCRVDNPFSDGIRLDDCDGVTLDHCVVRATGEIGIALATGLVTPTNNCTITGCKVTICLGDIISVNGSGNTITENKLSKTLGEGIEIDPTTPGDGNHITGNKVSKISNEAIQVTGTNNEVSGNSVSLVNETGILLFTGSGHTVSDNKLNKIGEEGIAVVADSCTVTGNTISKVPFGDAIDVDGAGVVCNDNVLKGPGEEGIDTTADGGNYNGNLIKGAKGNGFAIGGDNNVLKFNTAKGSKGFDLIDIGTGNDIDDTNVFPKVAP